MRLSLPLAAIAIAFILGVVISSHVEAQQPVRSAPMIIQQPAGHYSPSLRAWVVISHNFTLPWYQYQFPGARIVRMQPNSPLNRLGLRPGDVITRLDNLRVAGYGELDNHYDWTTVRFIRRGSTAVQNGSIYIQNSNYNYRSGNSYRTGYSGGQRI